MAVRHIVSYRLNGATDAERDEQATFLKRELEKLTETIPELESLTVHRNCAFHESNFDLVLVSEFANVKALETYIAHPDHQAAFIEVKARISERAAIDYAF